MTAMGVNTGASSVPSGPSNRLMRAAGIFPVCQHARLAARCWYPTVARPSPFQAEVTVTDSAGLPRQDPIR